MGKIVQERGMIARNLVSIALEKGVEWCIFSHRDRMLNTHVLYSICIVCPSAAGGRAQITRPS